MFTFSQMARLNYAAGAEDYSQSIIHYTSEASLNKILAGNQIWFGRIDQMNDASEYTHYWSAVTEVISEVFPKLHPEMAKSYLSSADKLMRNSAYISSWCEYDDAAPEGSLQMWRAYGDNCRGVGIVVDSSAFQPSALTQKKLNFFVNSSRVQYVRRGDVKGTAAGLLARIKESKVLTFVPNAEQVLITILAAKAPTSKHIGFQEEKEIRFIVLPKLLQAGNRYVPPNPIRQIATSDTQREFFALDLIDWSNFEFDLRPSKILKKVLIGPLGNPADRLRRVRELLDQHNLQHVAVELVDIPIRET